MHCCNEHKKEKQEENQLEAGKPSLKFSWWWCLTLIPIGLVAVWALKIPLGSLLPWGVFLLCPLMHVFMMKGHGEHDGHGEQKGEKK